MVFAKALCVVLLLYSASFGESRNLKNDSNSEKRMIGGNTGNILTTVGPNTVNTGNILTTVGPNTDNTGSALTTVEPNTVNTGSTLITVGPNTLNTGNEPTTVRPNTVMPTASPADAQKIAKELVEAVRYATGKSGQFAYIYLQPKNTNNLVFTNEIVRKAVEMKTNLPSDTIWPSIPDNTNFRFAFVNYFKPRYTNYGHSEYRLLSSNGLGKMITHIQKTSSSCPQYVILYSSLLPCSDRISWKKRPFRCADMTVQARKYFEDICGPGTTFYLYTDKQTPSTPKKMIKNSLDALDLEKNKITWIYP